MNGQQQQKIAEEKQKDELLKTYINDMKASLLDKDHPLKNSKKNSESRSIARTITLTTLTQLNSKQDQQKAKEGKYNQRKGSIMQFLYESGLIKLDPKANSIISLNTADLTFANLKSARLYRANLENANLETADLMNSNLESANLESAYLYHSNLINANLESVIFYNANLESAYLVHANLESAFLIHANLYNANLYNANLERAELARTNLESAILVSTNLESAYLYNVENLTNKQIKSACSWEKAIYTESDQNALVGWIAKDPKANQRKIDEIKQDKASDPPKPPDCSRWQ